MTIASKHLFAINACNSDYSDADIVRAIKDSVELSAIREDNITHVYLGFKDKSYLSIRMSDNTASEWESKPTFVKFVSTEEFYNA